MSRRRPLTSHSSSVDCCAETPLVNITTVAAAAATSLPMPQEGGSTDWLDPAQWSPYHVRRSSYVIATQDVAAGGTGQPAPQPSSEICHQSASNSERAVLSPSAGAPPPLYDEQRLTTFNQHDLDLPALLPLPSPGEPWTPTSADSLSPMPTPRHWDSLALGDVTQPEMEISSPDCPTTVFGSVGNHVNYSGRNALLMISGGGDDAITTVEGEGGWCNACQTATTGDVKIADAETIGKTTEHEHRRPAYVIRNLVIVCLSCVLVLSAFRAAECLESSLNDSGRLGVVSLCLMHAAAAGTCCIAPVMVSRLGAKWTMVAGAAFYVVWLAANCAPHPCTMLPAAASVGLGESLLLTAQVRLFKQFVA